MAISRRLASPRENKEIGEIGAGDQQDERDRAHEHEHARPGIADEGFPQRRYRHSEVFVFRIGALEPGHDGGQVRGRPFAGHAVFHPSDHRQEVVVARVQVVAGRKRHRHDEVGLDIQRGRPRREDADDGVRQGVEADRLADGRSARGEPAPPETVADERHLVRAPRLVAARKSAPERGSPGEDVEELGRDDQAARALRLFPFAGEVEGPRVVGGEKRKGLVLFAEGAEVGRRRAPRLLRRLLNDLRHEEPLGARVGKGPEQCGIDDAEHDGVQADPQREPQDRCKSKARAPRQSSCRVTEVLEKRAHGLSSGPR